MARIEASCSSHAVFTVADANAHLIIIYRFYIFRASCTFKRSKAMKTWSTLRFFIDTAIIFT